MHTIPDLIKEIKPWVKPTSDQKWTIGYLGSAADISLSLLNQAICRLNNPRVELLLAGNKISQQLNSVSKIWPNTTTIDKANYSEFSKIANKVDLWVLAYDDPYCIDITWELKVALYLASGRPVVRTGGKSLSSSGLSQYIIETGSNTEDIAKSLHDVIEGDKIPSFSSQQYLEENTWQERSSYLISRLDELSSQCLR